MIRKFLRSVLESGLWSNRLIKGLRLASASKRCNQGRLLELRRKPSRFHSHRLTSLCFDLRRALEMNSGNGWINVRKMSRFSHMVLPERFELSWSKRSTRLKLVVSNQFHHRSGGALCENRTHTPFGFRFWVWRVYQFRQEGNFQPSNSGNASYSLRVINLNLILISKSGSPMSPPMMPNISSMLRSSRIRGESCFVDVMNATQMSWSRRWASYIAWDRVVPEAQHQPFSQTW